jgi:transketolase
MPMDEITELENIAREIRKKVFIMCFHAGGGHIAPSFSSVEILVALYFKILKIDKNNLKDSNRDRFILSKGHASAALYAILAEKDIIDGNILNVFCQKGSILGGHPEIHLIPGVEASTGSLGHGLSFGVGIAFAGKLDKKDYRAFTLLSDGECQEGSVWEAAMFASHHKLDNLIAIIDHNKLQSLGRVDDIVSLEPFVDKWKAFGWGVREVNGHNISAIVDALEGVPFSNNKPSVLIAHTIKGKGISFMENVPIWHYRLPNDDEMKIVCKELGIGESELRKVSK